MQKKSFSWGIIALMFFLFFPIGIWMLARKMTDEKHNYIKNGRTLKAFSFVLIGFAVIYLIIGIAGGLETEDTSDIVYGIIVMLVLFGGSGAFALYKAQSYIKKGTKYNRYMSIIHSSSDTLIDNIAAAYPTTFEEAAMNLQSMIDDGYLADAYVDLNSRELILPQQATAVTAAVNLSTSPAGGQPTSVKCPNCGAPNKVIPGAVNECEYCGSPL